VSKLIAILLTLCLLLTTACQEVGQLIEVTPRLIAPGSGGHTVLPPLQLLPPPSAELPPEQTFQSFTWEPLGVDEQNRPQFKVKIGPGGSPFAVASAKLTPLFFADNMDGPAYVAAAYFRAHPQRTPFSIQPGDEFTFAVPADAFIVRWQEDRDEDLGQRARVRYYVNERGDRLRYYLTDPFPFRYEVETLASAGIGEIHTHPDLAFMLGTRRTDAVRLAQLAYRVADPDMYQVEAMRRIADAARPGIEQVFEIDHTHAYLDPIRDAWLQAKAVESVAPQDPDRTYMKRAVFALDSGVPYLAIEDSLGAATSLDVPLGRPFRITYAWDGTVRVYYRTGHDDAIGRRDPFGLRENERWAEIYSRLSPGSSDPPVRWGPGEPEDLDPFPTARDPDQQDRKSYDYLVAGRVMVLTFRPTRFQSDARAQSTLNSVLREARTTYKEQLQTAIDTLEELQLYFFPPRTPAVAPDLVIAED
jgi:hypothetical protein